MYGSKAGYQKQWFIFELLRIVILFGHSNTAYL